MSSTVIKEQSIEVVKITETDSITVNSIVNNDTTTVVESNTVQVISVETPEKNNITTISGDTEQLVIERKTIEIIEVINNNCPDELKNPVFTYDLDTLVGIEYDNGGSKTLSYLPNGQLDTISFSMNGLTILKQLNYDLSGKLTSITQTEA